jgi:hypothetical protein
MRESAVARRFALILARFGPVIPFVLLIVIGGGLYWVYDATCYGFTLTPDFMLRQPELKLREMVRRFERIKDRYEISGDEEAARKAARKFEQDFASAGTFSTSSGSRRRSDKLLRELHRFQESLQ